jgi:hypothetical protein
MSEDRATVLLEAVLEILNKCGRGPYVKDFFNETAFYDSADCDGYCLKEDIEHYLEYGDD